MAKVAFTDQAIAAINEIAQYISNDSPHYASLMVQKFFAKAELLESHPLAGRSVPELSMRSIREVFEGNYRIIYKVVNKDTIHILTVHHSKMRLKRTTLKK